MNSSTVYFWSKRIRFFCTSFNTFISYTRKQIVWENMFIYALPLETLENVC